MVGKLFVWIGTNLTPKKHTFNTNVITNILCKQWVLESINFMLYCHFLRVSMSNKLSNKMPLQEAQLTKRIPRPNTDWKVLQ